MDSKIIPKMKFNLEKQIQHIESIANKKQEEIEKAYYNKYSYLFNIMIDFLKDKDVLMYGGSAINELLPKKSKFYGPYELPDIDIFTDNASAIVKSLIDIFKNKHNITLISAKEALHENTYKVYSQGIQLLDITEVNKEDYEMLKKTRVKTNLGIYSVNIEFLKFTIHILSAQSYDAHRWTKVYERMLLLYETYPVKYPCTIKLSDFYTNTPEHIQQILLTFAQREKMPSFGWDSIQTYLKEDPIFKKLEKPIGTPIHYFLYNGDLDLVSKVLLEKMEDPKVSIVEHYKGDTFLSNYIVLAYNDERFCYIFNTRSCLSTININNTPILSLHSTITMLYSMYFSSEAKDLLCIVYFLVATLFKNLISRKKLFDNFILECYGKQKGIITLRRERDIRGRKNKNIFKK